MKNGFKQSAGSHSNLASLLPVSKVSGYCGLLRQIWDHVAKEAGRTLRGLLFFPLISINLGGDKVYKSLRKEQEICQNKYGMITQNKSK